MKSKEEVDEYILGKPKVKKTRHVHLRTFKGHVLNSPKVNKLINDMLIWQVYKLKFI